MKVLCAVCGTVGVLEVRGSSERVIHYQYVNGKRIFSRHKLVGYRMGTVGTELGTEKADNSTVSENMSKISDNNREDISLEG